MRPWFTGESDLNVCLLNKKNCHKNQTKAISYLSEVLPGMWDSTPHFSIRHAAAHRLHILLPDYERLNSSNSFIQELHIWDECDRTVSLVGMQLC